MVPYPNKTASKNASNNPRMPQKLQATCRFSALLMDMATIQTYWKEIIMQIQIITGNDIPFLPEAVLLGFWNNLLQTSHYRDLTSVLVAIARIHITSKWKDKSAFKANRMANPHMGLFHNGKKNRPYYTQNRRWLYDKICDLTWFPIICYSEIPTNATSVNVLIFKTISRGTKCFSQTMYHTNSNTENNFPSLFKLFCDRNFLNIESSIYNHIGFLIWLKNLVNNKLYML